VCGILLSEEKKIEKKKDKAMESKTRRHHLSQSLMSLSKPFSTRLINQFSLSLYDSSLFCKQTPQPSPSLSSSFPPYEASLLSFSLYKSFSYLTSHPLESKLVITGTLLLGSGSYTSAQWGSPRCLQKTTPTLITSFERGCGRLKKMTSSWTTC